MQLGSVRMPASARSAPAAHTNQLAQAPEGRAGFCGSRGRAFAAVSLAQGSGEPGFTLLAPLGGQAIGFGEERAMAREGADEIVEPVALQGGDDEHRCAPAAGLE